MKLDLRKLKRKNNQNDDGDDNHLNEVANESETKKKRGRPKKVISFESEDEPVKFESEIENNIEKEAVEENVSPQFDENMTPQSRINMLLGIVR